MQKPKCQLQKQMQQIENSLKMNFPMSIVTNQKGQINIRNLEEIERIFAQEEIKDKNSQFHQGRGGNNVSQNLKKSVISLLKKYLGPTLFKQYQERYIMKYHLKSQKENYVLFFLFLYEFVIQGKIQKQTYETIVECIKCRINKYILNSEQRIEIQPDRKSFHEKNCEQFKKFQQIDLDFTTEREYKSLKEWINKLYLKKKTIYEQAENKVRRVLNEHKNLKMIFKDLPRMINEDQKAQRQNQENQSSIVKNEKESDKLQK